MTDQPEAPKVEATAADLSPVSPSPLHSAASVALPVLQDTADLLDTMTEMQSPILPAAVPLPVSATIPAAAGTLPTTHQSEGLPATAAVTDPNDDPNDDVESLDDPYGELEEDGMAASIQPQLQSREEEAGDDDYLKSFDSPAQEMHTEGTENSSLHTDVPAPSAKQQSNGEATSSFPDQAGSRNGLSPAAAGIGSNASSTTPPQSVAPNRDLEFEDAEVDISRLVAEMAGEASDPPSAPQDAQPSVALTPLSLPPRPPTSLPALGTGDNAETYHPHQQQPSQPPAKADNQRLPPPPTGPAASRNRPPNANLSDHQLVPSNNSTTEYEAAWQQFTDDERRYMAEANWERFPEGTRIFIGNLSSERVSKRDVFDLFYSYGRLAQISLKSAYGFVQYHHVEEAQGAMQNLQNIDIKGRKIHLEISKIQRKKGREGRDGREGREARDDQNRTSERGGGRNGRDSGQKGGRADNSQNRRGARDEFRPGRGQSPRRNREEKFGRDRGRQDSHPRGRSRSPPQYGRQADQYRRRSPSPPKPYGRGPATEDQLQLPRRYGSQVPDVQFLLLQEVGRDFVEWVERAFTVRGLKVDVMFLNPNFPRDAVIHRQAVEGVNGIVDLDMRAHSHGKIPLRVFDRSVGGPARYDDYQDLDPNIAAELICRAKAQTQPQYQTNQPPSQPAYGPGSYGHQYPPQHHGSHHQPAYPVGPSAASHGPPAPAGGQSDMERLLAQFGNIDGAALQQLVAAVQASQQAPQQGAQSQNAQSFDINAILSSLNGGTLNTGPAPASYAPPAYPTAAPSSARAHAPAQSRAPPSRGPPDSASQVNTIMAQLAKFRQQ